MTQNSVPNVSQPNYHRSVKNVGVSPVLVGYIVAYAAGGWPNGQLATDPGESLLGVAVEDLEVDGPVRSVQTGGCAPVVTGGAFARGQKLTTDALGRAVAATLPGQSVLGVAATDSSGPNEWAAVELEQRSNADGGIQMLEVTVTHEDLTAAATSQTLDVGASLPPDARVMSVESELVTPFSGGDLSALTASLGIAGALTSLVNARNVFTGQATVPLPGNGTRPSGSYDAEQLQAQFSATGDNVADIDAGEIVFRVFYIVR